jgi:phosphoribosylformylglycinamidine synthase subunit PurS
MPAEGAARETRPNASGPERGAGMKAVVTVMLKAGVLDPQGKAVRHALHNLGFGNIGEVRAGKIIELELNETDPDKARSAAEEMARRLLANTVIESFRVSLEAA